MGWRLAILAPIWLAIITYAHLELNSENFDTKLTARSNKPVVTNPNSTVAVLSDRPTQVKMEHEPRDFTRLRNLYKDQIPPHTLRDEIYSVMKYTRR